MYLYVYIDIYVYCGIRNTILLIYCTGDVSICLHTHLCCLWNTEYHDPHIRNIGLGLGSRNEFHDLVTPANARKPYLEERQHSGSECLPNHAQPMLRGRLRGGGGGGEGARLVGGARGVTHVYA